MKGSLCILTNKCTFVYKLNTCAVFIYYIHYKTYTIEILWAAERKIPIEVWIFLLPPHRTPHSGSYGSGASNSPPAKPNGRLYPSMESLGRAPQWTPPISSLCQMTKAFFWTLTVLPQTYCYECTQKSGTSTRCPTLSSTSLPLGLNRREGREGDSVRSCLTLSLGIKKRTFI